MFIPVPVAYPGLAFPRLGGKSVRRGGASNDSRGGCAPQNEDGSLVPIIGWCRSSTVTLVKTQKLQNKANCKNQINYTNTITCTIFCFKKHKKNKPDFYR